MWWSTGLTALLFFAVLCDASSTRPKRSLQSSCAPRGWLPLDDKSESYRLANGVKVFLVEQPSSTTPSTTNVTTTTTSYSSLVAVHATLQVGSRHESSNQRGLAHALEHMLYRHNDDDKANSTTNSYIEVLRKMGGNFNAFTTPDGTNYHSLFYHSRDNLQTVLQLEAERLQQLQVREDDWIAEAGAIESEFQVRASNEGFQLMQARHELAYQVHPYRYLAIGTWDDVLQLPNRYQAGIDFYRQHYRPDNLQLLLVGTWGEATTTREETKAMIQDLFGQWPSTFNFDVNDGIPEEPLPRAEPLYQHVTWPQSTLPGLSISFNTPAFDMTTRDIAALDVLFLVALDPAISPLYQTSSRQSGGSSTASGGTSDSLFDWADRRLWRQDPSLFVMEFFLSSGVDSLPWIRDAVLDLVAQLRTSPISPIRLETAVSHLSYQMEQQWYTSTDSLARSLQAFTSLTGDLNSVNELVEWYHRLTPQDLMDVANLYFLDGRMTVVTIANDGSPPPMMDAGSVDERVNTLLLAQRQPTDAPVEPVALPDTTPCRTPDTGTPFVYFELRVLVGSADEDGVEIPFGLASLTAKLLAFTATTSAGISIEQELFRMAAFWTVETYPTYTAFLGKVHVDYWQEFYDGIVAPLLFSPLWSPEEFGQQRRAMEDRIYYSMYNDVAVAQRAFDHFVFPEGHPYQHNPLGTINSLSTITLGDAQALYNSYYTPDNVVLGMKGAVDDAFIARVNEDLATQLPSGPSKPRAVVDPLPPQQGGSEAYIVEQETPTTLVMFGFPLVVESMNNGSMSPSHPDYPVLWILTVYYGGTGLVGRLQQQIRVKRGINYRNTATMPFDGWLFQGTLGRMTPMVTTHFATRLALWELHKLVTDGLTQESLDYIRDSLIQSLPLEYDTQGKTLTAAMNGKANPYGGDKNIDYVPYMTKALQSVTMDDVSRVISQYLQDNNILFVFVTSNASELATRLMTERTSVMTYDAQLQPSPEQLMEDQIVQDYPLGLVPKNIHILSSWELFPGTLTVPEVAVARHFEPACVELMGDEELVEFRDDEPVPRCVPVLL